MDHVSGSFFGFKSLSPLVQAILSGYGPPIRLLLGVLNDSTMANHTWPVKVNRLCVVVVVILPLMITTPELDLVRLTAFIERLLMLPPLPTVPNIYVTEKSILVLHHRDNIPMVGARRAFQHSSSTLFASLHLQNSPLLCLSVSHQ